MRSSQKLLIGIKYRRMEICKVCKREAVLIEVPVRQIGGRLDFILKQRCPYKDSQFDGHLQIPVTPLAISNIRKKLLSVIDEVSSNQGS